MCKDSRQQMIVLSFDSPEKVRSLTCACERLLHVQKLSAPAHPRACVYVWVCLLRLRVDWNIPASYTAEVRYHETINNRATASNEFIHWAWAILIPPHRRLYCSVAFLRFAINKSVVVIAITPESPNDEIIVTMDGEFVSTGCQMSVSVPLRRLST